MIVPLTVRGCDKNTPPSALSPAPGVVTPTARKAERIESEREILPQASGVGIFSCVEQIAHAPYQCFRRDWLLHQRPDRVDPGERWRYAISPSRTDPSVPGATHPQHIPV